MNTLTYIQPRISTRPQHFIPLTSPLLSIAGEFKSVIKYSQAAICLRE